MKIIVPASSANLGPGFDSIGLAVNRYLTMTVGEETSHWQVDHDLPNIPHDETNMVVQAAIKTSPTPLTPHHLTVVSNIPLSHGLGSSSSANVAGVELANQLGQLNLTDEEKVQAAASLEGHPDNVAPAIMGGIVIGTNLDDHFYAVKAPTIPYQLAAYVPDYNLATADSRAALPDQLAYSQATHASAIANVLVAALFKRDYQTVGKMMEADHFHEPYRSQLVPELAIIREIGHRWGTLATYLSGAGPTVMTIVPENGIDLFARNLRLHGLEIPLWQLSIDDLGVRVED